MALIELCTQQLCWHVKLVVSIDVFSWINININAPYTMFVPIEARRASAGISPSETVLISRENNYMYCDRNTTYPLYITSFHCYMTYWSKYNSECTLGMVLIMGILQDTVMQPTIYYVENILKMEILEI